MGNDGLARVLDDYSALKRTKMKVLEKDRLTNGDKDVDSVSDN